MFLWRRRVLTGVLCLFLFCVAACLPVGTVRAVSFTNAMVKPSRMKVSVNPMPILVTVTVGESAIEDHFQITLGSAWFGSSTAGDYSVSTSNLPAGVTAWLGISTADSVSGSTVTFPSGDLVAGTTYGFYITGGITANPATAGQGGNYVWNLATIVSGSPSSTTTVSVPAIENDSITITAQVLPPITDFSADIITSDLVQDVPQETEVTYTITYGSTYTSATPLTVVADWSLGTIAGASSANISLLEYVAGSASTGYGGVVPVVNLSDRTITWSIASFPGNTSGETVTFTVRTTGNYTGATQVTAEVSARITNPVITTASSSTISYLYVAPAGTGGSSSSGSSTSTVTPTAVPSTASTTTAVPITQVISTPQLRFVRYTLSQLTDSTIGFTAHVSNRASLSIEYGTNSQRLLQKMVLPTETTRHAILLTGLRPQTHYYVRLTARDGTNTSVSDLLSFVTAKTGDTAVVDSVAYTSDGINLFSTAVPASERFLFPLTLPLEITLGIRADALLTSAQLVLSGENGEQEHLATLSKTQTGVWTGRTAAPLFSGDRFVQVLLLDALGAAKFVDLGMIRFSDPITIVDEQTGKPIERARVFAYTYDTKRRLYERMRVPDLLSSNPLLSQHDGSVLLAVSPGKYQIEAQALGYDSQTVTFDTQNIESFPAVALRPARFPIFEQLTYHVETVSMALQQGIAFLENAAVSSATVRLITLWTIAVTSPLTVLGLLAQFHFSLRLLVTTVLGRHRQFVHHLRRKATLHGVIKTTAKRGVSGVIVNLLGADNKSKLVVQTRASGGFVLPANLVAVGDQLLIIKPGFVPQTAVVQNAAELPTLQIDAEPAEQSFRHLAWVVVRHMVSAIFELNLCISLGLGLLFTLVYHTNEAVPFVIVSGLNALIYLQQRVVAHLHITHFAQT